MNWKIVSKMLIKIVATGCVGAVIDNAVKFTTPVGASPLNRASAQIGGFILSSMIGDKAAEYVDAQLVGIFGKETPEEEVGDAKR